MTIQLDQPLLTPWDAMDAALTGRPCMVVAESGTVTPLAVRSWLRDPDEADRALFLDRCMGQTLDIGCGPGRLTTALTARGVAAFGIDVSREAVRLTRRRGAGAKLGDVFAPVPHPGRWSTALLADGNIGIGGDPVRLLRRIRDLLAPGGCVLVELGSPGSGMVVDRLRLRVGDRVSAAFNWAFVGVDAIDDLAAAATLSIEAVHGSGGRFVGVLSRSRANRPGPTPRGQA